MVLFNDNSHESFEIPSIPSGVEKQASHLHDDQDCSKESRSFRALFPSDMHSHPDSLQINYWVRSRTKDSAESGEIVSLVNIIGIWQILSRNSLLC